MNNEELSLDGRLKLRPVVMPDDTDFLIRLYAGTRDDLAILPIDEHQKKALLLMQYEAQKQGYAVEYPNAIDQIVLLDEKPIGRYMIERKPGDIFGVDLALLPESRSLGIGTQVIRSSFEEAAATKSNFVLHVVKSNRAVRLYLRLGCVVAGNTETHHEMTWQPSNSGNKTTIE